MLLEMRKRFLVSRFAKMVFKRTKSRKWPRTLAAISSCHAANQAVALGGHRRLEAEEEVPGEEEEEALEEAEVLLREAAMSPLSVNITTGTATWLLLAATRSYVVTKVTTNLATAR